jgi:hypothetical protein
LRRSAVISAALIGEDGVCDVTIAPRNDAAAVAIGGKSWPFDIRLRPWVSRPHIGLLPLRYPVGGEVRSFATNGLETGRFKVFVGFNRQYVRSGHYTVRGAIFLVLIGSATKPLMLQRFGCRAFARRLIPENRRYQQHQHEPSFRNPKGFRDTVGKNFPVGTIRG